MRILAACLVGALGLGALMTMAACSDSTDDTGSAGAGGAAGGSAAGAGGKPASAGATSTAGTGGGAECKFESDACRGCLGLKCGIEALDCNDDPACKTPLYQLQLCVCDATNDSNECFTTFVDGGGDNAKPLIECYADNCTAECQ